MTITISDLARQLGGTLHGDGGTIIRGAARLDLASPTDVSLADHPDRSRDVQRSMAGAVIATADVDCGNKPRIVVDDVHKAFTAAVLMFRPVRETGRIGVSPAATISETARLAEDVDVYPGAHIGDDVVIGPGSTIHSGACLMAGCTLGTGVTVFPNVVCYENTRIGDRCLIHAGAVLGAYGFGYHDVDGRHELSAQLGHVEIGDDVEIGAGAAIDRGTYGPTLVGEGTKIDNLVMIAHNCRIGRHNLICSQVGIAGSTSTGDYVVMAGQVGVRDHVHIGEKAILCSKAGVSNDVAAEHVMLGQPATQLRQQKLQMAAVAKLPEMRRQFRQLQRELTELRKQFDVDQQDRPGGQAA